MNNKIPIKLCGIAGMALLLVPVWSQADITLVDDTWAGGVRNVQNLPGSSAWYYSSNSRLVAAVGSMTATVDSSRLGITYFTDSTPYQIQDGETLKVTVEFTPEGVNTASMSRGMRIGLFNFANATRFSEDDMSSGDNGASGAIGYLLNMNFSQTFNISNPLEIRRRNGDQNVSGNLMGSVPGGGLYSDALAAGGENGAAGFSSGVRYTLEYSVSRSGNTATITTRFSNTDGWSVELVATDSATAIFDFDSFAFRPDGTGNALSSLTFHRFKVEVLGGSDPDPDPDPVGQVLVNDNWGGGVRNVQDLPASTAWYASSASRLNAVAGSMTAEVDGSSRLWATYFTDNMPLELVDGQSIRVSSTFTLTTVNNASLSKGLRIGLFNSANATRFIEDGMSSGDNGSAGVTGYLINMNFAQSFKVDNPIEIRRRDTVSSGNMLGSLGVFGDSMASGGGNAGDPAFVEGRTYTMVYEIGRSGDSVNITISFSDDQSWNVSLSATDSSTSAVTAFDTFVMRADNLNNTANFFTFTNFKVEVTGSGSGGDDYLDPAAFTNYLNASDNEGGGWYYNDVLGSFYSPSPSAPYIYLPFMGTGSWMKLQGTSAGLYYFYDVGNETWWATAGAWKGTFWSFDYQAWYWFDGEAMVLLPGQEDENPPPVGSSSITGYATVEGMGLTTTTGGKGGPTVQVNSIAQLKAEAAGASPKIIVVTGDFEGGDSISVGSNKTIVGAHPGVYLKGIGFEMRNVSNVIIRNFKISHVLHEVANDGDCIRIVDGAHHIWIDHCEVFNENPRVQTNKDLYDGLIDITNGSDFVTVSWTHLHDHHKFILIGSTDTASRYNDDQHLRVTLHNNLLENPYKKDSRIGTRVPSLRFGKAHVFNNVYRNLGEGVRARHATAHALVEENVFDYLGYTWSSDNGGCFTIGENLMINEANKNAQTVPFCSPDFAVPYDYSQHMDPAEIVEDLVTAGVGIGKIDPLENLP